MFYQYIKIKIACFDRSLKYYLPITQALNIFQVYQYFTIRGVSRIMEKYRHKLFLRGVQGLMEGPAVPVGTRGTSPEAHGLHNRKGDIFDHFGSALNNIKFRLFCTFLTIPLQTTVTRTLTSLTTQTHFSRWIDGHFTLYPSKL